MNKISYDPFFFTVFFNESFKFLCKNFAKKIIYNISVRRNIPFAEFNNVIAILSRQKTMRDLCVNELEEESD
ncbi:hypothetical protein BOSE62_140061 [Bosea sp. 62]|nr:hypothetical protein BOSE7B_150062 [Bosea sp. 7B]CAD5271485.1 hypothetical protein BOSE21B_20007 [Bosea sp. 21B]CAD5273624.1 hypothetical protein BOSE46_20305 [Bosea sp. 46]VVT56171.1 hypothetical protein BOS5A_140007 [Bosea sp. EC-HK365B]VXB63910.1 hypothetical protein BOSE62_140061 [Bosea sp. 62]VXC29461.1 hypothetical protein BOSE127_180061 [Bosea sp. 127]VXC60909.1 hypothetical protein BOSE125_30322 [Bosea sp. 125]